MENREWGIEDLDSGRGFEICTKYHQKVEITQVLQAFCTKYIENVGTYSCFQLKYDV